MSLLPTVTVRKSLPVVVFVSTEIRNEVGKRKLNLANIKSPESTSVCSNGGKMIRCPLRVLSKLVLAPVGGKTSSSNKLRKQWNEKAMQEDVKQVRERRERRFIWIQYYGWENTF